MVISYFILIFWMEHEGIEPSSKDFPFGLWSFSTPVCPEIESILHFSSVWNSLPRWNLLGFLLLTSSLLTSTNLKPLKKSYNFWLLIGNQFCSSLFILIYDIRHRVKHIFPYIWRMVCLDKDWISFFFHPPKWQRLIRIWVKFLIWGKLNLVK